MILNEYVHMAQIYYGGANMDSPTTWRRRSISMGNLNMSRKA